MSKMTAEKLVEKAIDVAKNRKTLYVMGCFGAPMNAANKKRYTGNNDYNRRPERTAMIQAASTDTFGFDCVGLIKALLWGWRADQGKTYGGASYESNGVPDYGANKTIQVCKDVSTDFRSIIPGEAVWKSGHIGIYIGDGLAVECTPSWDNKAQITAVGNIGTKSGYHTRAWTKHGKLPWVDYTQRQSDPIAEVAPAPTPAPEQETFTSQEIEQIVASVFQNCMEQQTQARRDNDAGSWSKAARAWAAENGLISGIGKLPDGTQNYAWEDAPTREQLVQILYRYDRKRKE